MTSVTLSISRLAGTVSEAMSWLKTVEVLLVLSDVVVPTFDRPLSEVVASEERVTLSQAVKTVVER